MREYKYYPEDFGKLPVKVLHMDLDFDVFDDHTAVTSALHVRALEDFSTLALNAKNLEIVDVTVTDHTVSFIYYKDKDILQLSFPEKIQKGKELSIITKTVCRPTNNILEGLYYDETPKGAPPQQITQCQQWGFQRIVPCIDDMTAKCTYKTSITADSKYTHLLTNGDISIPRKNTGGNRTRISYDNIITPMATYLFFLGCGTYAAFSKSVEYPDGKKFMLELLVPPNSNPEIAERSITILHDSVMWIHLFTGPEKYANHAKSMNILALTCARDSASSDKEKNKIREQLRQMIKGMTLGYKYTGTVYREIGMQNSCFGGMENVGNTTITTNQIMPVPDMTDSSWEYMIRVKVHEFYHNLNGSEVTGQSPFEIWLNEAVTVFIEKEYHAFLFGKGYARLHTVLGLLGPGGTFIEDEGAATMPIEPDGFNDPNELISGMTYSKAPEFVHMIETLIGKEKFVKALDLYHRRYKHANATRSQWVQAMEEISGLDLKRMSRVWLKQTGYPRIIVNKEYNAKKKQCIISIKQKKNKKDEEHWEFPLRIALVDTAGKDIAEKIFHIINPSEKLIFENVKVPAFLSINRWHSCYAKFEYNCPDKELYLQARKDQDPIARYLAFYHLADKEKMNLIKKPKAKPSAAFMALFREMLLDEKRLEEFGSLPLSVFEGVEDKKYAHEYQLLYDAKKKLSTAIAQRYTAEILACYKHYTKKKYSGDYTAQNVKMIKARQVKNFCLSLLSKLEKPEFHKLIKNQFLTATCASDKFVAFDLYVNSTAKDKIELINLFEKEAGKNLVLWAAFLSVIGGNDSADALDIIRRMEKTPQFRIEQSNDQRSLYGRFAGNRKRSLLTPEGREFFKEIIIRLAPVNEYTTVSLIRLLSYVDFINKKHQPAIIQLMLDVRKTLDQKSVPSVYNTLMRILKNSKVCQEYVKKKGSSVKLRDSGKRK